MIQSSNFRLGACMLLGLACGAHGAPTRDISLATPAPSALAATQVTPLIDFTAPASLAAGVQMYADRNYVGAIDRLTDAIGSGDLTPDMLELAKLYLALATTGRPSQSAEGARMLGDFISDYPASALRADALTALAGYLFDNGEYGQALKIYRDLDPVTLNGAQLDSRDYYMAYCLLTTGTCEQASRIYERLARGGDYAAASRFYLAYIAYLREDYDTALRLFDSVDTGSAPGDMTDNYRAQIYYNRRQWDKAYKTARTLIDNRRDASDTYSDEARRIAGESAFNLGRHDKAMPLLTDYIARIGDDAPASATYALGVCRFDRGSYDEAAPLLGRVADLDNVMGQSAALYLGQCYLHTDDYDAAALAFERASRMNHDSDIAETAFYNYAVTRSRGGRVPFGSSVAVFEEFVQRYPASRYDTEVRSYLAYGYMADDNYAAALRSIERIADKSPELQRAHQQILYNLGARRVTAGDLDSAAELLNRAATMRGGDEAVSRQATLWLADCRYRQKRYEDAAALYERFINAARRDTPNLAAARYSLGYALFASGRHDRAATAFRRYVDDAHASSPAATVADAECRLGDIAFKASRFAEAGDYYDRALQRDPSTGDYPLYQQAMIKGYHSDYNAKIELLTRMLADYPRSARVPSALLEMAESYRLAGKPDMALNTYDRLIATYPTMPQGRQGMLLSAQLHLNRGDNSEAVTIYKRLVSDYPSSTEARTAADALKDLYAADGNIDQYVSFIRSVPNAPGIEPAEIDRLTYESAERHFIATGDVSRVTRYLEQHPGGAYRAGALLCEARAALDAGDDDTALNRATAVAVGFADAPEAPSALLIKGTVEARQGRDEDAMHTLMSLMDKAPDAATVDAARMGVMRAALRLNELNQVVSAAKALEGSSNLTPADRLEVDYTHAAALCRLGRYDEAAALWAPASTRTDEVYGVMSAYRLGQMYLDQKQYKDASRVANALVDSNTPHEYWLARGFILLSDVLRAQGKKFEADEYLRSLRANYPGTEADIFADIESRLK